MPSLLFERFEPLLGLRHNLFGFAGFQHGVTLLELQRKPHRRGR